MQPHDTRSFTHTTYIIWTSGYLLPLIMVWIRPFALMPGVYLGPLDTFTERTCNRPPWTTLLQTRTLAFFLAGMSLLAGLTTLNLW